ncbi:hypothetical protein [Flavobacterium limi]|uniref:Lipocalin-like domain-containing protein n=1 Tax=Flavobacterium limi TaxID=2045105 RepID=A0ABQ1TSW5_9FLAO|nr:hypothetical protein [Flavobacterium limi]GGF01748.1 hypothetical protein GCM10011518_08970 [Flavobacterium limi]
MKKLFFLFYSILLFSCSSNSDDNIKTNSSNSDFHPPSWIEGTWKGDVTYKFFQKDVYQNQISFKGLVDGCNLAIPNSSFVSEPIKNNTEYKFSYVTGEIKHEYHFIKISSTEIKLLNPNSEVLSPVYTKQ